MNFSTQVAEAVIPEIEKFIASYGDLDIYRFIDNDDHDMYFVRHNKNSIVLFVVDIGFGDDAVWLATPYVVGEKTKVGWFRSHNKIPYADPNFMDLLIKYVDTAIQAYTASGICLQSFMARRT